MTDNEPTLRAIIEQSHETALAKGWWQDGDRPILEQLCLMHSELSEACEQIRDGHRVGDTYYNSERSVTTEDGSVLLKPEGFLAELSDVLIRMGDTIARYGLTSEFIQVLREKQRYNSLRPYRHGGKTA